MAAIERAMSKPKNEIPKQDKKKPLPPSLARWSR